MKTATFVCAAITCALLVGSGFSLGSIPLGGAAIIVAMIWTFTLWSDALKGVLSFLLVVETVLAVINVLYGTSVYLGGAVIVLALVSWELALAIGPLAPFSKDKVRPHAFRHVTQMLILAIGGYAFLVIPLQVRLQVGFRIALGLGLAAFLLFALLLRPLAHRGSQPRKRRILSIIKGWAALKAALKEKDGQP